ncbi:MAG: VWA domain-containing protein [Lutibacter sp.]|uniref:VWA domain-containing protein n=1 Tax=Lutibacter sp. TaxID=1925666 RepID=UPI00299D25E3|nr:VWA domain-containing protein [Lutibacter sp.]MDX1828132.1 VWA domain-containing protein [Lutibacter sp.]
MTTITVLLIITAFFTALIITVFQYFFKSKNEGKVKYWLSLLRFLSVFLILIVLINPSINKTSYQLVKPKLFVAVDNSQSIKFNKNDSIVTSLIKQVKNSKQLNSKFDINYYSFGDKIKVLDSLTFKEKATNLSLPLETFSEIAPISKSPIILISDGNQTAGTLDYTNIKNTVFPVIVGDTTTFEDIKISNVNVNATTNIDNNFPVELFINYDGKLSVTKKLTIYNGKKLVFSKEISLTRTDNSKNLLIYLKAAQKGNQYFKATIEPINNEKNKLNNTAYFSTKVIDNPTKIAIISTIKHPDIGALKNAIESKKQFKITLTNNLNKNINISDYQLYILYQPDVKFNAIFNKINNLNKNYFIISGLHTNWNYLNKAQNYFTKNDLQKSEKFECFLNEDYSKFNVKNIDFTNFSPLTSNFGNFKFNQSYQTLLFKKINGIETKQPLLSTLNDGNRKVALLSGEGLWRWRMQSFAKNKTFINFDNFIASLIQYLSGEKTKNSIKVTAKPIYNTNEKVEISAIYFNENFEIDTRNKIWLTLFDEHQKQIKKIPFTVNEDQYKVFISNLKSGNYWYVISDKNQHIYYKNNFKITNFNIEEQFQNSNTKNLAVLAKNTNGKLIYPNELGDLITNLVNNDNYQVIQNKVKINESLINYKWILFLIALFLSVEWFVRKYIGKM